MPFNRGYEYNASTNTRPWGQREETYNTRIRTCLHADCCVNTRNYSADGHTHYRLKGLSGANDGLTMNNDGDGSFNADVFIKHNQYLRFGVSLNSYYASLSLQSGHAYETLYLETFGGGTSNRNIYIQVADDSHGSIYLRPVGESDVSTDAIVYLHSRVVGQPPKLKFMDGANNSCNLLFDETYEDLISSSRIVFPDNIGAVFGTGRDGYMIFDGELRMEQVNDGQDIRIKQLSGNENLSRIILETGIGNTSGVNGLLLVGEDRYGSGWDAAAVNKFRFLLVCEDGHVCVGDTDVAKNVS